MQNSSKVNDTPSPTPNTGPNAVRIPHEVGHLLMETVRRNNVVMDDVREKIFTIRENSTGNPFEITVEMQRLANELLELRK
jgi:hypothetical protein